MLSDEEKKAIERLNKRYDFFKENPLATNVWLTLDIHNLGIVLNLIEKQSKEIEELKEDNKHQWEERCKLTFELENSTSNDKIKAKIEEYNETLYYAETEEGMAELKDYEYDEAKYGKKILQSLLEKE